MFYSFIKVFIYVLAKIFLRLEISGTENIPLNGPVVIASNHVSLLDPPIIGVASSRKIHFMAKQELFVPILGSIYRTLGAFPVRRGAADRNAIKYGIDLLLAEKVLAIFPEGTRSKTGVPKEFAQSGFKILCKYAPSAYVVPMSINDSWKFFKFGIFPYGLGNRLTFVVHKPIAVKDYNFEDLFEKTKSEIINGIKI